MGTPVLKCPLDLWMYQEILSETRPDVIVETGTHMGGSARYLAGICDLLGHGRIVTVDVVTHPGRPDHDRITYLVGSSTSDEVVARIAGLAGEAERVMVILDSDHARDHVLREALYAPLVSPGCYLVVEDTNVNGHPVVPGFGPVPMEAVTEFVSLDRSFEVDPSRERLMLTFNPSGYLRRRGRAARRCAELRPDDRGDRGDDRDDEQRQARPVVEERCREQQCGERGKERRRPVAKGEHDCSADQRDDEHGGDGTRQLPCVSFAGRSPGTAKATTTHPAIAPARSGPSARTRPRRGSVERAIPHATATASRNGTTPAHADPMPGALRPCPPGRSRSTSHHAAIPSSQPVSGSVMRRERHQATDTTPTPAATERSRPQRHRERQREERQRGDEEPRPGRLPAERQVVGGVVREEERRHQRTGERPRHASRTPEQRHPADRDDRERRDDREPLLGERAARAPRAGRGARRRRSRRRSPRRPARSRPTGRQGVRVAEPKRRAERPRL